jgi:PHP family Zn ribbon phosphoesterase
LSLSSKAHKLFSKGKSSVQVATRLDVPEVQATEFRLEYLRLIGLDELVSLFASKGQLSSLLNLFDELVVKRGMSIEQIVLAIEISIHKLPNVENLYEQAKKEVDRLIEKRDYLLFDRNSKERTSTVKGRN